VLPLINTLKEVEINGWSDAVGRWSVAYEAMYANIPNARAAEFEKQRKK
jgi:hypothetical protein